ncbi:hypothetical protein [Streptomyces sp. 6N223]|uniref:hypothetical protein n=1 Tax=Streptomyces sp. 6N223 TaxID=3457412 RepID=UPI003FCF7BEB
MPSELGNLPSSFSQRGVRCSLLRPDAGQRARLVEIRDNLNARIAEAEREGWLGEIEGLEVSLAGAQDKIIQLDAEEARRQQAVDLRMPSFRQGPAGKAADPAGDLSPNIVR